MKLFQYKTKQKSTFNKNFDAAIQKLLNCTEDEYDSLKFKLIPIEEEMGKRSSKDNWMMSVLKHNNLDEFKSYESTIQILSGGDSHYPLWINLVEVNNLTIEIKFSTRFRHIKTSHNQELGHPPFKITKE